MKLHDSIFFGLTVLGAIASFTLLIVGLISHSYLAGTGLILLAPALIAWVGGVLGASTCIKPESVGEPADDLADLLSA